MRTLFGQLACGRRQVAALQERQRDAQVREPQHIFAQVDLRSTDMRCIKAMMRCEPPVCSVQILVAQACVPLIDTLFADHTYCAGSGKIGQGLRL